MCGEEVARVSDAEREQRFDTLFESYSPDMVAYCNWRTGSLSDAQDAVAEVFLTAWRRLDDVPRGDAARVWLYATARRVLANQRRSSRRRVALHERLAREAAGAPQEPRSSEEEALVHDALWRLGPRDREVLLLAEWEGLTPAQIGAVVGCLTVTARGRGVAFTPSSRSSSRARRRHRRSARRPAGATTSTRSVQPWRCRRER
jgi:RNA polymerase sigma factor (sigma-70 family)